MVIEHNRLVRFKRALTIFIGGLCIHVFGNAHVKRNGGVFDVYQIVDKLFTKYGLINHIKYSPL